MREALNPSLLQAIRRIWQQCAKSDLPEEESAKLTAFRHATLRKMKLADILSLVMEKNGEERDSVRRRAAIARKPFSLRAVPASDREYTGLPGAADAGAEARRLQTSLRLEAALL